MFYLKKHILFQFRLARPTGSRVVGRCLETNEDFWRTDRRVTIKPLGLLHAWLNTWPSNNRLNPGSRRVSNQTCSQTFLSPWGGSWENHHDSGSSFWRHTRGRSVSHLTSPPPWEGTEPSVPNAHGHLLGPHSRSQSAKVLGRQGGLPFPGGCQGRGEGREEGHAHQSRRSTGDGSGWDSRLGPRKEPVQAPGRLTGNSRMWSPRRQAVYSVWMC